MFENQSWRQNELNMPIEFSALGIAISGCLILIGARRWGFRLLLATIALSVCLTFFAANGHYYPEITLDFVPTWMKWVGGTIGGLWVLQFAIGLLFGRNVADNTIGIIISEIIMTFVRTLKGPGKILRRLFGSSEDS